MIEKYGSGIARIKNECKAHGIKEPKFEEFQHGFKVSLFKEKSNVGVNELYCYIKENQTVKMNILEQKYNNVTKRTIERWLKQLKDENKIEFKGSPKKGGYYVL